jgi:hypothetical protein
MREVEKRRFRFSVGSLMILVAACALLLVPFVWVARQTALLQAERAMADAERARALAVAAETRAVAEQALYRAEVQLAESRIASEAGSSTGQRAKRTAAPSDGAGLWAGLAVNHSVVQRGATNELIVEFTLVNDAERPLDPKITDSRIIIDGVVAGDSGLIFGNGPPARREPLAPGGHLQFTCALGRYVPAPGVHQLVWEGAGFRSPKLTIRVLPEKTP